MPDTITNKKTDAASEPAVDALAMRDLTTATPDLAEQDAAMTKRDNPQEQIVRLNDIADKEETKSKPTPDYSQEIPLWRAEILADLKSMVAKVMPTAKAAKPTPSKPISQALPTPVKRRGLPAIGRLQSANLKIKRKLLFWQHRLIGYRLWQAGLIQTLSRLAGLWRRRSVVASWVTRFRGARLSSVGRKPPSTTKGTGLNPEPIVVRGRTDPMSGGTSMLVKPDLTLRTPVNSRSIHITNTVNSPTPPARLIKIFRPYGFYILLSLLLTLVFYSVMIFGRLDRFVPKVAKILAVPVALIDWRIITYDEFDRTRNIIQRANRKPAANSNTSEAEIEKLAKDSLINDYLIYNFAAARQVSINPEMAKQIWQELIKNYGSPPAAENFTITNLGLNLADYKKYVVEPYLLRLTVLNYLNHDPLNNDKALRRLNGVKGLINSKKTTFAQAALNYSEDPPSRDQGGELGWFAWGSLDPEFENAVAKLKIDQVSEPVHTSYGYHLIQLLALEKSPDQAIRNYRVAHIFLKTFDFDNWLAEQKKQHRLVELMRF
ncbi:MAG: peptidylprolyl isomerase [Patescibacteria group bacterium]